MDKPLIIRDRNNIIISHNGRKLIQPLEKYNNLTDEEILAQFIKVRNIRNDKR